MFKTHIFVRGIKINFATFFSRENFASLENDAKTFAYLIQ